MFKAISGILAVLLLSAWMGQNPGPSVTGALSAGSAGGTITPVGTPVCNTYASATNTLSYTPHATGDTLVVTVGAYDSSPTLNSVKDSAGNSYTLLASYSNGGTGTTLYVDYLYGTLASASGITGVVASWATGPAGGSGVCVSEYSGPVAFGNTGVGGSTAGPATYSVSATTQDANNYIVLGVVSYYNGIASTSSGTIRAKTTNTFPAIAIQDNSSATTGTVTNAGTFNYATTNWAGAAIELRTL